MNNQFFSTTFEKHLNVGGQQREEILAEVNSHLEEVSANKLGDPKKIARKSNRVHLGLLSSLRQLIIFRLILLVIFELGAQIAYPWVWNPIKNSVFVVTSVITSLIPTAAAIIGAFAISRMHRRWEKLLWWSLTLTIAALIFQLYNHFIAKSVFFPPELNIFWWYITNVVESFIVTYLLSTGIMLAVSGRQAWLPKHPWIDVIGAFVLQAIGALLLSGYVINFFNSMPQTNDVVDSARVWVEGNPFTFAIIIGAVGGLIEAIRINTTHKKT